MLDIVLLLAVLATLLVVVAVSQPVAVRLKLAPVVLLAVIGVAIGAVSIVLVRTPLSARFGGLAGLFANLPVGASGGKIAPAVPLREEPNGRNREVAARFILGGLAGVVTGACGGRRSACQTVLLAMFFGS